MVIREDENDNFTQKGNPATEASAGRANERAEMRTSRRDDPFRGFFWGMMLVLLGVLGILSLDAHLSDKILQVIFLAGAGGILIAEDAARHLSSVLTSEPEQL